MANNYTPNYNQYLTQTAGYALPSGVRTYSVFDPSSNSWRKMTNDGRSPMQQGTQADVQAALRYADSSQGKVWDNPAPAQPMTQTQTPGILLRPRTPAQASAQTPLGGPRIASPASRGGTTVVPMGQPKAEAPAGSQAVPAGNPYMGYAEIRKEYGDPEADVAFLNEQPRGVLTAGKVTTRGVGNVQSPFATPVDVVAANRGLPPTGIKRTPHTQREFIEQLSRQENIYPTEENVGAMLGHVAMLGLTPYGLGVKGALGGVRQFADPRAYVSKGVKALPEGSGAMPMGGPAGPSGSTHWTWKARPNTRRTYSQATREAQRPVDAEWVEVTPTSPAAINGMPSRSALPAPATNPSTGFGPIRTQANMPSGMPIRLGGHLELPPAGVGVQPMGRTASIIRSPMEMTTPSGLARWQYRLDQLSGLGR